jgi:adenylate kinase
MDIVLFGMQGSGKGTQSQKIAAQFGLKIFETGAELRRLAEENSELGQKVKNIMTAGHLVPTEVVMEIIEDFAKHLPDGNGALFDGIPRSEDQREQFDALMNKTGREFKGLLIEISEEEALKRLTTRRICDACKNAYPSFYDKDSCESCGGKLVTRQDDTPEAIRVRLDTFLEKTIPVIEHYKNQEKMITIRGEQSIAGVESDILEALNSLM